VPDTSAFTSAIDELLDRAYAAESRAIADCQAQTTLMGVRCSRSISAERIEITAECDWSVPYGEVVYVDVP
jgi:hypothetical protein